MNSSEKSQKPLPADTEPDESYAICDPEEGGCGENRFFVKIHMYCGEHIVMMECINCRRCSSMNFQTTGFPSP